MHPFTPPQDVTQLLQAMVRIDSVNSAICGRSNAEDQLRDYIQQLAASWDLTTRRLPVQGSADQLLILWEPSPGKPWLLFDSHLDTVSVAGMTIEPFGAHIEGDRMYGRGSCDTKGTGAAMLWALHRCMTERSRPNNVALLFSVDEEVRMTGIQSFTRNDLPNLGIDFAAAIIGEPTACHPVVAHNGCARWVVITHGKAAHSSVPHEGCSAISAMMPVVAAIETRYAPNVTGTHPLTGSAACTVNLIQGGSAVNIIPDYCRIDVDRRTVPGERAEDATEAFRAVVAGVSVDHTLELGVTHPPLNNDANGGLAALTQAILRDMGLPAMCVGAPFATHATYLAAAGVPTIVLGPGDPHPAHTRDEWVSLTEIERGVELYYRLMHAKFPA